MIYVWFDALCNYVTALGYGHDGEAYRRWWDSPGNRVHLLGKGVLRFHAVYWPAMLLSSGQPLPTGIFVHDYLTAGGRKISKSAAAGPAQNPPCSRRGTASTRCAGGCCVRCRGWVTRTSPSSG